MEDIKFLKSDIKKSIFLTLIILGVFAILQYLEFSQGFLTSLVVN